MTPSVTLFLRTYRKDAPWVVELMRSFDRWVKIGGPDGFRELVVHVDQCDVATFKPIIGDRGRIVSCAPWGENGYKNQQVAKLNADLWCKSPYILYLDSDYMVCDVCTPDKFFVDGKPDLLITPYSVIGHTVPWQNPTQRILGFPVEYESMRGPRLCHPTELLPALRNHIVQTHGLQSASHWLAKQDGLSEFNLMGSFAWRVAQDRYHWRDTTKMPLPSNPFLQFWSVGGITPEVRMKIEAALA